MNEIYYAKGITAQNLRVFLELWPLVKVGIEDTKGTINDCNDQYFDKESDEFIDPERFIHESFCR